MNARINRNGVLVIEAMNEQETYLLQCWMRDNVQHTEDGDISYNVNSIEVRLDDE